MITINAPLYKCTREIKRGRPLGGSIKNCACVDCTNIRRIKNSSIDSNVMLIPNNKVSKGIMIMKSNKCHKCHIEGQHLRRAEVFAYDVYLFCESCEEFFYKWIDLFFNIEVINIPLFKEKICQ